MHVCMAITNMICEGLRKEADLHADSCCITSVSYLQTVIQEAIESI